MLTITHLDHLVLRVTDLRAMMAFYTDVLGCPVEKIQENLGLYQLRAGSALIDLVPIDGPLGLKGGAAPGVEGRNLDHFCLRVEPFDAEAIIAHLRARGADPAPVASRTVPVMVASVWAAIGKMMANATNKRITKGSWNWARGKGRLSGDNNGRCLLVALSI